MAISKLEKKFTEKQNLVDKPRGAPQKKLSLQEERGIVRESKRDPFASIKTVLDTVRHILKLTENKKKEELGNAI